LLDFNTKVGREDIFKPTLENESLSEINKDNEVRILPHPLSGGGKRLGETGSEQRKNAQISHGQVHSQEIK
jgi:hypothetical protein